MFKSAMRVIGVFVAGILLLLGSTLSATVAGDDVGKPGDKPADGRTGDESQTDITDPDVLKHDGTDYS